jgi:hypothetical protein
MPEYLLCVPDLARGLGAGLVMSLCAGGVGLLFRLSFQFFNIFSL